MRTFLRFERRFLPVPVHRLALATFALAFVCATSSAAAQRVETKFDMEFPNGNDTSLISEVETFVTGKYITNTFFSDIRDGLVQVNWKDKNGGTLLTGVDDQTLIIGAPEPGVIASATFWSSRLGAGIFAIKTREADGVGDFTGSHTSKSPCLDLKCPAKYLEPVPSSEGVDRSGRLRASTTENAAAGPIVIGETEGRLGARQYTSPPTVNPNAFTPIFLLTFASKA